MKWIPAVSGLVATLTALIVLGSVSSGDVGSDPVAHDWDVIDALTAHAIVPASEDPAAIPVPIGDVPVVEVAGVDDAVGRALGNAGYAEFVAVDELRETLPDSVLSLLISEHAVLLVEEGA